STTAKHRERRSVKTSDVRGRPTSSGRRRAGEKFRWASVAGPIGRQVGTRTQRVFRRRHCHERIQSSNALSGASAYGRSRGVGGLGRDSYLKVVHALGPGAGRKS